MHKIPSNLSQTSIHGSIPVGYPLGIMINKHVIKRSDCWLAFYKVMRQARPGMKEYQLESIFLHHVYMYGGCRHCSYTCICATGDNRWECIMLLIPVCKKWEWLKKSPSNLRSPSIVVLLAIFIQNSDNNIFKSSTCWRPQTYNDCIQPFRVKPS